MSKYVGKLVMTKSAKLIYQPDLKSQVKSIKEDGYTYFPSVLDKNQVAELKSAMDQLKADEESFSRHTTPNNLLVGKKSNKNQPSFFEKSVNNAFNHDPLFIEYLDRAEIIDLEEALHGKDYHIIGMTAWITGPGRPDQSLPCDWLPIGLPEDVLQDARIDMPVFITTTHYYLNDLYEELGPTKFIPGSHKSGRMPNSDISWNGIGEQSLMCKAGDAVTFRCEVWHRGTKNVSHETRYLLQVHYAHRMISQKFPPYLNRFQFNPEIVSKCSPRQLRLLGDHVSSNYD